VKSGYYQGKVLDGVSVPMGTVILPQDGWGAEALLAVVKVVLVKMKGAGGDQVNGF